MAVLGADSLPPGAAQGDPAGAGKGAERGRAIAGDLGHPGLAKQHFRSVFRPAALCGEVACCAV